MKVIKSNEEAKKLVKDGVLRIDDDVRFECNIYIEADIHARNIDARNIDAVDIHARNIDAGNIHAGDIDAGNIDAVDIHAGSIHAGDIDAGSIHAGDIDAGNIDAVDIDAVDISYYAVCFAYHNIKCTSIEGRRENSKHFALDGEVTIKPKKKEKKKE